MNQLKAIVLSGVLFFLLLSLSFHAQAAEEFDIAIFHEGFSPQVVKIPVNTTVTWENIQSVHTTTSTDGLWDSGVLVSGETFSYTFDEVGLFYYYDTIHDWPSGVIEVVHSLAEIEIFTDKTFCAAGDDLEVGLSLDNPGAAADVGIYIWMTDTDGMDHWLLVVPKILMPAGFSFSADTWMHVILPPLARGTYTMHAALLKWPESDIISRAESTWVFGRVEQTDWSGGPASPEPAPGWENKFGRAQNVSWRAIPGQVALTAQGKPTPEMEIVTLDAGRPDSVAMADIDGDGLDDLITTDPVYDIYQDLGAVYWWKLETDGVWNQHTVDDDFYGAQYATAFDLDRDGDQDVLVAAYYGDGPELGRNGKYGWIENLDGQGGSWEKHLVGDLFWGAIHIKAGDIDGDGDNDLIGASELTDGIYEQDADIVWFENLDGEGHTWGQHDLDVDFPNASEAHLVDMDGDNDLDIVGTYSFPTGPSTFAWWENENGDASAWNKRFIPFEFWGSGYVAVGDIDGDGDTDLLGGGYNTSQVGFWENLDGKGTDWVVWYVAVMPSGRGAELKDVDGDGDLDGLLWNTYWVEWLENLDGTGYSWNAHYLHINLDRPWSCVGEADNNGRLEIAVSSEGPTSPEGAQILLYDVSDFTSTGALIGSVIDGMPQPGWGIIDWTSHEPPDTSLVVQVRAADDIADLGAFLSVPHTGFDLSNLIDPQARYLQYRVLFSSTDPDRSPLLHEIHVNKGEGF